MFIYHTYNDEKYLALTFFENFFVSQKLYPKIIENIIITAV